DAISFLLYFGGMTGALLTLIARWFEVDSLAARVVDSEIPVLGTVLGMGLVFLVAHYTIQGLRLALLGARPRDYLRRMVPAVLAEAALLPLAAIVVYLYDPDRPV